MQDKTLPQLCRLIFSETSLIEVRINSDPLFDKYRLSQSSYISAFRLVKQTSYDSDSSQDNSSADQNQKRRKRGSYRKYTLEEKQQAVRKIAQGHDVKQISKIYGIPRRNLLRWKKNGCQRKEGGGRPTDNELENILYTKILCKDLKSEKEIRDEAKKLSKSGNFKASKGWYSKFNRRFISRKHKTSESQESEQ